MHQLSAVANCPEALGLVDHATTLPYVWSILGWNVHAYHSHLDVHPPLPTKRPFRFEWHQDGGRQNREIETDPRPRLSVKYAFWLSDVSETGRGNFKVVPGSHRTNWIAGPPRRDVEWPDPDGAIEVTANAGDAVLFDRRLWHARSDNYSTITRKAMFVGYTYRWVAMRDENDGIWSSSLAESVNPVQRQLLGGLPDTDGVTEARDANREFYPLDERVAVLAPQTLPKPAKTPRSPRAAARQLARTGPTLLDLVRDDLLRHVGSPPHDDAAMLLIRAPAVWPGGGASAGARRATAAVGRLP
jgi:hypothetical protein